MALRLVEEDGVIVVEGPPDQPLLSSVDDATRVIEACFSGGVNTALLYGDNLPHGFFDLSSGKAGEVMQKLRNYGVRLAVVCPPGRVKLSRRFGEMLREERRGRDFGVFETRQSARQWLGQV
jgi:hypothetical protein